MIEKPICPKCNRGDVDHHVNFKVRARFEHTHSDDEPLYDGWSIEDYYKKGEYKDKGFECCFCGHKWKLEDVYVSPRPVRTEVERRVEQ